MNHESIKKAYDQGAEIQVWNTGHKYWMDFGICKPQFTKDSIYRIKPKNNEVSNGR